jgi:hypothetical protein
MKSEFVELQKQVKYLQRNYLGLVEKLRLIEVGSSIPRESLFLLQSTEEGLSS